VEWCWGKSLALKKQTLIGWLRYWCKIKDSPMVLGVKFNKRYIITANVVAW
jgi:hypothetical protein